MQSELGTLLRLERWSSFEQGADFLRGLGLVEALELIRRG